MKLASRPPPLPMRVAHAPHGAWDGIEIASHSQLQTSLDSCECAVLPFAVEGVGNKAGANTLQPFYASVEVRCNLSVNLSGPGPHAQEELEEGGDVQKPRARAE